MESPAFGYYLRVRRLPEAADLAARRETSRATGLTSSSHNQAQAMEMAGGLARLTSPFTKAASHSPVCGQTDRGLGGSFAGPARLRCPGGEPAFQARHHLYFAHPQGRSIRPVAAESLSGPWTLFHTPLRRAQTAYQDPLASPDVVEGPAPRQLRVYLEGGYGRSFGRQSESVALAADDWPLKGAGAPVGPPYWRVLGFETYGLARPRSGRLRPVPTGLGAGAGSPSLLPPRTRRSRSSALGSWGSTRESVTIPKASIWQPFRAVRTGC